MLKVTMTTRRSPFYVALTPIPNRSFYENITWWQNTTLLKTLLHFFFLRQRIFSTFHRTVWLMREDCPIKSKSFTEQLKKRSLEFVSSTFTHKSHAPIPIPNYTTDLFLYPWKHQKTKGFMKCFMTKISDKLVYRAIFFKITCQVSVFL